ncbi:hypothetical protein [Granulicella sp. S190]|uniref:hypothetical protein n=1 Tax=Granulicella sp. S190 TaxID=1747226 RepID=UPI00131D7BEE|nr:hypothetical protein [Granulicella sp. S190]
MARRAARRPGNIGSFWRKDAPSDLHETIAWIWIGWASATLLAFVAIHLFHDCQILHTVLKHETNRLNQLSRTLRILRTA